MVFTALKPLFDFVERYITYPFAPETFFQDTVADFLPAFTLNDVGVESVGVAETVFDWLLSEFPLMDVIL